MTTQNRRPSFSSSTTSSLAKRHAPSSSSENVGKVTTVPPPHVAKKRTPLGNLTNRNATSVVPQKASRSSVTSFSSSSSSSLAKRQASFPSSENVGKITPIPSSNVAKKRTPLSNRKNRNSFSRNAQRSSGPSSTLVPCVNMIARVKKNPPVTTNNAPLNIQPSATVSSKITSLPRSDETVPGIAFVPAPCSMDMSPTKSDCVSVSLDETMSTCDSFKSPEVEYVDNNDVQAVDCVNRETFSNLCISDCPETTGNICNRDVLMKRETDGDIVDVDNNYMDPQMCATIACDIYKHLRASEVKKRPSTDFMEKIQKDINTNMRAILIDWLVEVAEEYRLVPDTLYLTVNYIDRYLSGNVMNRQRLQLLGVACMMIASKYEEICAPQVEEFCYITDNTYFKEEILQMESAVLNYLKFEMTAPTTKCFLRRFVRAAQGTMSEAPAMQLECMANYIAELSLLEYNMLCYAPSLIAASAIYLANFILLPSRRPWNSTLQHYTLYEPSDLCDCVKDLHRLCLDSQNSSLPAIREKHSQHKYKYVAKKHCPPIIPTEFFHN